MEPHPHPLDYPSKLIGNIHRMLLFVASAIFIVVFLLTLYYVIHFDFYLKYLASIDQALLTFGQVLSYILIVTYLIWLIMVHSALKQRYSDYPIGSVGAVVRMLPLINLWGLGSTFSTIGSYFYRKPELHGTAQFIHRFVPVIYIVFFVSQWTNRKLNSSLTDASDGMILTGSIMDAASFAVYFWMTLKINQGIQQLYTSTPEVEEDVDDMTVTADASVNATIPPI